VADTAHLVEELARLRTVLESRDQEIARLNQLVDSFLAVDIETGMLNRTGLLEAIHRAWTWWNRRREPFGVMAIQIPEIAELSPEHAAAVASRVASALSEAGRAVDDTGRLDAQTFAVVLREFQLHGATSVVSRIRTALRQAIGDPAVTADMKFGLVVAVEGDGGQPETYLQMALDAADRAEPEVPNFVSRSI
jgi:GGDEF domain-containing protein